MNFRLTCTLIVASVIIHSSSARAVLNEFSVADGYMSPFSTRVWTYNGLWSLDGGAIGNNYVAQHGYNAGFATSEPFALVVRNDSPAGNYQFSYNFVPADVAGVNPANMGGNRLTIGFDVCSTVFQNSGTANNAAMLTMKFGGTAGSPGLTLGFSDSNYLMWSNGAGVLSQYTGYQLNGASWDRITLVMNFATDTYDLFVQPMTGNGINGSNTYTPTNTFTVVTGMPFTNALNSMPKLFFETFTDPEDGAGWHKMFLDHFTSSRLPEPSTIGLLTAGLAAVVGLRRRRYGLV
jgi:hypothetical protein